MLGNNIKVHFAGTEQISFALAAHYGGVKYMLWTCFPFVAKELGIKHCPQVYRPKNSISIPQTLTEISKHDILDSGLFTLMFGAGKGQVTEELLERWFEVQTDFINSNHLKAACVEIDCQRVLSVEKAWQFRQRFRDALPNNRQINVFHLPDGKKGLDRLIEFSHYIAISVPEWRLFKGKAYKDAVVRVAHYVKNKKPEIDIHMLGCTEESLLPHLTFCTSADSTSWQAGLRFGNVLGNHIGTLKKSVLSANEVYASQIFEMLGIEVTPSNKLYASRAVTLAQLYKRHYTRLCGSQE